MKIFRGKKPMEKAGLPLHTGAAVAQRDIKGYFETCGPDSLTGWATDAMAPGERLEVSILCDGVPAASIVADIFREDVLAAGTGDGRCGFHLPVPQVVFDGREHTIEVRELSTGVLLDGSPRFLTAHSAQRAELVLEGGAIRGHARVPNPSASIEELELLDDGVVIAAGRGWHDSGQPGVVQFYMPVPPSAFDGRPHAFVVRAKHESIALGSIALVMPVMLTPEDALMKYAREGLRPALATMAGFRYESLNRSLAQMAQVSADAASSANGWGLPQQLAQLTLAHARLVRGFNEKDKDFPPLTFPTVAKPKVSVVIPVHNKFHVTYHCLLSLLVAPNQASFEVILVDDGSKDESTTVPELIKGVQYLRNEEAQGFIRACNRGAEAARGEYIVMLNNDTEVTSGWIDELLWTFDHFLGVGMAGAKLLYPNGTLQEAGGIVWNTGNPWNYGRQANPHEPRYNYARQVDYLSGACVMLPLKLWNEIGGFSETYVPAYFEDTDLGFQVRDRGYKTVYAPFSQVVHFEGISNGTAVTSGTKRYQEINRPKFKQRWINACRNNGKEGVDLELNKDRNVDLRALVIDAETPMPDQNAGSYAAIQEMRMLQALGFKCTFAPTNMAWMGRYTENLQRMGVECLYAPFAGSINEVITARGAEFDLVYITRYYVAQDYIDLIRQHAPQAKIVLCNADLHFLRELRTALANQSSETLAKSIATRDAELATMRKVNLVLSYTDVEKAVIESHNLDSTKVAKCPWVTEVVANVPGFAARQDVAFLGGYNHHPNAEAVEWFVQKVVPLMREALPGVKFRVYGSNVPKSLLDLAAKNDDVIIDGWVADVAEVYNTCRVFVAPLQSGAGIKGKVVGALAHGVPCVLSPLAAEGIAVGDGVDAYVTSKPDAWATAIARIYQDEKAWTAMSAQARVFAGRHYGLEKGIIEMQDALQHAELFATPDNQTLVVH